MLICVVKGNEDDGFFHYNCSSVDKMSHKWRVMKGVEQKRHLQEDG
jgi:hypothetical protein